ncbi:tyrosine-type recombinase/integrase [Tengunoibacter tsumagoiensis]|uniref:Site-specific integrase n=1 Tax=Tengunoibacter tsumagoiensis TaxID=2014871 RepID=A0A402A874_9CHLR|nr:tyrosine-type recombinase/integrase [Tengunoibacter tsumagoiensis]GCE15298.1 site-specific integrase [Tengunoibacter tsumagoiensis]
MAKKEQTDKPEKKRRARGEGTVLQRADGRWVARVPLGDGKRKEEYYDTKQEAERAKRRMLNERDAGNLAVGKDQTFGEYLLYWIGVHGPTILLQTYSMYLGYIKSRLIPGLGHVKMKKLTVEMFQELYQSWDGELSPNTIRLIHSLAKQSLNDAVVWKKILYNPVAHAKLPKARRAKVHVFTDEELSRLLEHAKKSKWYVLFVMALFLGMREGELLGLKWSDIDFKEGVLQIHNKLYYTKHPVSEKMVYIEGLPKTAAGQRLIVLPSDIIDLLRNHLEEQKKLQEMQLNWKGLDLVFCTRVGGFMSDDHIRHHFSKLLKEAGIEHTKFHALRHNASMLLRRLGIDPVVRKEMLGHSSISMTDDVYGHATRKMHKDAASQIENLFKKENE